MNEYIIFIGIAFWLVYFAQTFEDIYIKAYLKLLSTGAIFMCTFFPLSLVGLANKEGLYETFNLIIGNGLIFLWILWSLILFWQLLQKLLFKEVDK